MKLFNLFKKESKSQPVKFQKLEKNQLSQVIGGGDGSRISMNVTIGKQTSGPGI